MDLVYSCQPTCEVLHRFTIDWAAPPCESWQYGQKSILPMLAKDVPILLHLYQTMVAPKKTFNIGNLSRQWLQALPPGPPMLIKCVNVLDCGLMFASMANPPGNLVWPIPLPKTTHGPPNVEIHLWLKLNIERKEGREDGADILFFSVS